MLYLTCSNSTCAAVCIGHTTPTKLIRMVCICTILKSTTGFICMHAYLHFWVKAVLQRMIGITYETILLLNERMSVEHANRIRGDTKIKCKRKSFIPIWDGHKLFPFPELIFRHYFALWCGNFRSSVIFRLMLGIGYNLRVVGCVCVEGIASQDGETIYFFTDFSSPERPSKLLFN